MGTAYLLDTNIIIYLINGTLNPVNSRTIQAAANLPACISIITKMEVLGFQPSDPKEAFEYEAFITDSIVLPLSDEIVEKTIQLRKFNKIKLLDAIIAATALTHNLILVTRNEKDFTTIQGLVVSNPFAE